MNGNDIIKYGNLTVLGAIQDLPETEWDTPGVTGYWSVKNIISHLASFELMLGDLLINLQGGSDTPTLELFRSDPARFNDVQVDEMRAGLAPNDALDEYREAFDRSSSLFADLPEDQLRVNGIFPWYGEEYDLEDFVVYTFYGHKREHSAEINHFRNDVLPAKRAGEFRA